MIRCFQFLTMILLVITLSGCNQGLPDPTSQEEPSSSDDRPTVAYITNGIASFWDIAEAGALKAGQDFDVEVLVHMPPNGIDDQKRMLEDMITLGVDGVAVSPINSANQLDILNQVAENTTLITHDSDAADSNRELYIGMSNYDAGRICGELVQSATADIEGTISLMIFVGRLGQDNARERRQGLIDQLMGRDSDSTRFDEPGQIIKNDRYVILGTRTDDFDFSKCKAHAEDSITTYPELNCMVGLFAYNPPQMLEAITSADKLGEIRVVGFDEDPATLQAITDGTCYGTVVQNPFEYGYQSVKVLSQVARGEVTFEDMDDFMDIPARKITHENVTPFWKELNALLGIDPNQTPSE
ncbi:MAG: substrate-binding domain-containing protein [Planctomycetota bacterium]|nr:substrate-binding domain-containing protein [Planctomycetota bacterium]